MNRRKKDGVSQKEMSGRYSKTVLERNKNITVIAASSLSHVSRCLMACHLGSSKWDLNKQTKEQAPCLPWLGICGTMKDAA